MVDLVARIKFVGGVASGIYGVILFGLSSTYKISFGKLGIYGILLYQLIIAVMLCLICLGKRVRVPDGYKDAVTSGLFIVICLISVLLEKLLPKKSDALTIISYALFSISSLCTSRASELGFETGFFSFFLSMFVQELFKTKWELLPIALVFCFVALALRHRSESLPSPNGDDVRPEVEVGARLISTRVESQREEVSGQGRSSMDNVPDNPNQAFSEGDGDNSHNNGGAGGTSSFPAPVFCCLKRRNDGDTIQKGFMHSSSPPQILRRESNKKPPFNRRGYVYGDHG